MAIRIRTTIGGSYFEDNKVTTILASEAGVIRVEWIEKRDDLLVITTDKVLKVVRELSNTIRLIEE